MEEYRGVKFRVIFLEHKPISSKKIMEMLKASRSLQEFSRGNEGNISLRFQEGMLISAAGSNLGKLDKEDIVYVKNYDMLHNTAYIYGKKEPSSETPMHWLIYKEMKNVGAILHIHDSLVLENEKIILKLGIKMTEKEYSYGTISLAKEALRTLMKSENGYIILRNHGSLIVGKNLSEVIDKAFSVRGKLRENLLAEK